MDAELKASWIAALRSGEYPQTQGRLRQWVDKDEPSFCCLGVLCEVHPNIEWRSEHGSYVADESLADSQFKFMSLSLGNVGIRLGLDKHFEANNGATMDAESILMGRNDRGETFDEIADWIEENL